MGHLGAGCGRNPCTSLPNQNILCLWDSAACCSQSQDHELGVPRRIVLAESGTSQLCVHPPSSALHLTPATPFCRFYKPRLASLTATWNVSARNISLFPSLYPLPFILLIFGCLGFFFSLISVTSQVTSHVPSRPFLQLIISHELLIHQVPMWISFWSQLVQLFTALRDKQILCLVLLFTV